MSILSYSSAILIYMLVFVSSQSPCPDVFEYQSDGKTVFGVITVNYFGTVSMLQIRANFTIAARLPNSNYVGRIEPLAGGVNQLQDYNRGAPLQYRVDFPVLSPLPRITSVSANENLLCYGSGDIPTPTQYVTTTSLQHTLFLKGGPSPGLFQHDHTQPVAKPDLNLEELFDKFSHDGDAEAQIFSFNEKQGTWTSNKYPDIKHPEYQIPVPVTQAQIPTTRPPPQPPQYHPEVVTRPPPQQPPIVIEVVTQAAPTPPPPRPVLQTPTRQPMPQQPEPSISNNECGIVAGGNDRQPLIFNGQSYSRGDWPWLVAIYKRKDGSLTFICSGTLVSDRHVITAAHCMQSKSVISSNKDIVVKVGVYNLEDWGDDITITRTLAAATIHEEYNATSLANDILILTFDRSVDFNTNIRPACLWNGNSDLSRIVGASGVVAGWGQSERGQAGRGEPRVVRIPVVSTAVCRASRADFHKLTSSNTLCAGDRNGAGPCNGDSGGGLYLLEGGRWRLRGVVSLSLRPENGDLSCNLDEYIVFTDSAQYIKWIQNVMHDTIKLYN